MSKYDLEERTLKFAKDVRTLIRKLPMSMANKEDGKQLIRSSGSVGANYREANESLSKKDFLMRIKICRKEASESRYWLSLIDAKDNRNMIKEIDELMDECLQLQKIFGSIVTKQ